MSKSKYQCDLCEKSFMQKIDLDRHKTKKNACVPIEKITEIKQENEKLKKQMDEKQKHDIMKSSLSNLFKWCLDLLRDQEHLTGDKALRTIAYLLILRLSEPQIENGNIDIDNIDYYNEEAYEVEDIKRYMTYTRFSTLKYLKEEGLVEKMKNLRLIILCEHPKFRDLFQTDDPFRIKHDSTFAKLIKKFSSFPFEDYDADIQGEAYEEVIKDVMIGKVLGQFFTPPLLKQFMIELVDPQILKDGKVETIFDPAMGTGGFLITSLRHYINKARDDNIKLDWEYISKQSIGGREAEPDTYQLCKANMLISSGHTFDTLEKDDSIRNPITKQYDIILTNPPFGIKGMKYEDIKNVGSIKKEDYIPISSDSAISLFLQAIIHMLKIEGRCATVVPNGKELFNKGVGLVAIREYLMKTCNLKEVFIIPGGIFNNTDVKTCIFYFEKKKNRKDVLNVEIKGRKADYKFIKDHCTETVKFYDYDPFKKEKRLLIEVDIKDIEKNSYSLNYTEYIKENNDNNAIKYTNFKFEEVCKFLEKSKRKAGDSTIDGKYNFYTSSFDVKKSNYNDYNTESIIIGTGGNATIHYDKIFGCSADNFICTANKDNVNIKYVYYYLLNNLNILGNGFHGATIKHLTKEYLTNIKIQIPPLETQKEIVEILDFLSQAVDASGKKIEELKQINKIIMDSQCKYGVNETKQLKDICVVKTGEYITKATITEGTYPVYGGGDASYCISKFNRDNTLVINKDGVSETCVRYVNGKFFLNHHGWTIDVINDNITKEYLFKYLLNIQPELYNLANGAAQKGINQEKFYSVKCYYPSLETQKEIVKKMEQNDAIIEALQKEIQNNKQLAKEILNNILKQKPQENNIDNKDETINEKPNDNNTQEEKQNDLQQEIENPVKKDNQMITNKAEQPDDIQEVKTTKKVNKSNNKTVKKKALKNNIIIKE